MLTTDDTDREDLNLLLHSFKISRVLGLIADLGVADKVPSDGHITVDDLAAACVVQPEPMLRVLRMLAALKIFQVTPRGTVARAHPALTPVADGHSRKPSSRGPLLGWPRVMERLGYA